MTISDLGIRVVFDRKTEKAEICELNGWVKSYEKGAWVLSDTSSSELVQLRLIGSSYTAYSVIRYRAPSCFLSPVYSKSSEDDTKRRFEINFWEKFEAVATITTVWSCRRTLFLGAVRHLRSDDVQDGWIGWWTERQRVMLPKRPKLDGRVRRGGPYTTGSTRVLR